MSEEEKPNIYDENERMTVRYFIKSEFLETHDKYSYFDNHRLLKEAEREYKNSPLYKERMNELLEQGYGKNPIFKPPPPPPKGYYPTLKIYEDLEPGTLRTFSKYEDLEP